MFYMLKKKKNGARERAIDVENTHVFEETSIVIYGNMQSTFVEIFD